MQSKRGIKHYIRKPKSLEEQLDENLKELEQNPNAKMLPITEGYLAFLEGEEVLEEWIHQREEQRRKEESEQETNLLVIEVKRLFGREAIPVALKLLEKNPIDSPDFNKAEFLNQVKARIS